MAYLIDQSRKRVEAARALTKALTTGDPESRGDLLIKAGMLADDVSKGRLVSRHGRRALLSASVRCYIDASAAFNAAHANAVSESALSTDASAKGVAAIKAVHLQGMAAVSIGMASDALQGMTRQ